MGKIYKHLVCIHLNNQENHLVVALISRIIEKCIFIGLSISGAYIKYPGEKECMCIRAVYCRKYLDFMPNFVHVTALYRPEPYISWCDPFHLGMQARLEMSCEEWKAYIVIQKKKQKNTE